MDKQIKMNMNGTTRRIPAAPTFAAFVVKVRELFEMQNVDTNPVFVYVDDEGDNVVVSDEEEYSIALGCGVNPIKMNVTSTSSTSAAAATLASAPPADANPSSATPAAAAVDAAGSKYATEMAQLEGMGFERKQDTLQMLEKHNGDVAHVVTLLTNTRLDDCGYPHHPHFHQRRHQPHDHHHHYHGHQNNNNNNNNNPGFWHVAQEQQHGHDHNHHHHHGPWHGPWRGGAGGCHHHYGFPPSHHPHHQKHNKEWKNHPFMQLDGEAREAMKKQLRALKESNNVDGLVEILAAWGFDRVLAKSLLIQHKLKVRKVVKILASSPSPVAAASGASSSFN